MPEAWSSFSFCISCSGCGLDDRSPLCSSISCIASHNYNTSSSTSPCTNWTPPIELVRIFLRLEMCGALKVKLAALVAKFLRSAVSLFVFLSHISSPDRT
eukprot:753290-Hanusia_phi.AAC.8